MGSPIEDELFSGILDGLTPEFQLWEAAPGAFASRNQNAVRRHGRYTGDDRVVWIVREHHALSYRIDILMSFDSRLDHMLAIECDGHEWHDRTKQQAAYDRARDRELFANGVYVIRFTGSEIYHSVDRCVDDVRKALRHVAKLCSRHDRLTVSETRDFFASLAEDE